MKKLLNLLLSIVLALSLVACSNNEDNVTNTGNTNQTQASENENAEAPNTGSEASLDVKSDEVSYEALMQIPQSPGEDFDIQENHDGDSTATITRYKGSDTMVYIPDEIDGLKITRLDQYIFNNDDKTPKAVRLGDNVRFMERGVFGSNNIIEIFVSGSGLEEITDDVFISARNLKEVRLNDGLKIIGPYAFSGTSSLKVIELPSSLERVGDAAFFLAGGQREDNTKGGHAVIRGKTGSLAEKVAEDNNLKFEAID